MEGEFYMKNLKTVEIKPIKAIIIGNAPRVVSADRAIVTLADEYMPVTKDGFYVTVRKE
jgi:hypothetical protein